MAVGQVQVEQQISAVDEEIRVFTQKIGDIGSGQLFLFGLARCNFAHMVIVPS